MAATWKKIITLSILLHVYLIIGMVAFHFLETEHEENTIKDTNKFKELILRNFTCLDEESLDKLIAVIAYAVNNGIDPSKNTTIPSNWEYHSAFFFSGTVITTIGYGHISPNTRAGKAFCVIYALIGIPLCGFLLSEIGDKLYRWKDLLQQRLNRLVKKTWQQTAVNSVLTGCLGLAFFVFIPALIFAAVEDWLYRDAVYFSFITLTTIGFGDYIPGQNLSKTYPSIYKVATFYWIMVGLSYLALIIQNISKAMSTSVEGVEEHRDSDVAEAKTQRGDVNTKYEKINTSEEVTGINDGDVQTST